jgi:hypothetical protein
VALNRPNKRKAALRIIQTDWHKVPKTVLVLPIWALQE